MPTSFHGPCSVIRITSKSNKLQDKNKAKVLTSRELNDCKRFYNTENVKIINKQDYKVKDSSYKNNLPPGRNKSARPSRIASAQPNGKNDSNDTDDAENVRMNWNNYHRLKVIHNFLEELASDYPSLCTTDIIGQSVEGRDLKIVKISDSNSSNASVWIDSGIHAREWIAPAVSTYIANHIARNFDSLPESVRNKDWYFLPVLNPDGYEYSHTNNRMWRKNKALIRNTLFGVDLNRNFSLGWGAKGSSDEPKHHFYRGPRPFSEPESAAMRDVFLNWGITFKVYITLHSFGEVIIFPFAYKDKLAADYIRLLEGATVMAKAIYNTNGTTYKVGISRDVMYPAAGTSNDWSHGEVGIPFCYLIELRSKTHKFKLPKEEIEETGEEILNCVVALMEFIDNYKEPVINSDIILAPKNKDSQTNDSNIYVPGIKDKDISINLNDKSIKTVADTKETQQPVEEDIFLQLYSEIDADDKQFIV